MTYVPFGLMAMNEEFSGFICRYAEFIERNMTLIHDGFMVKTNYSWFEGQRALTDIEDNKSHFYLFVAYLYK